jgi:hypothetical protein
MTSNRSPEVPPWLRQHFQKYSLQLPHFEASWYGPIDKLLNVVFHEPHFMVKPQAKLRTTVPSPSHNANDPGQAMQLDSESTARASLDSQNAYVLPSTKHNPNWVSPDFILVVVSEEGTQHIPLACIEVKRTDTSNFKSVDQILRYMAMLDGKGPHPAFVGFLITGPTFQLFYQDGNASSEVLSTVEHLEGTLRDLADRFYGEEQKREMLFKKGK